MGTGLSTPQNSLYPAEVRASSGEVVERRTVTVSDVELREDLDEESRHRSSPKFVGHAAVFNQITDLGFFREQIAPGAFAKTIKEADVRFLFNHNPDTVMARTKANSLRLSEDAVGLLSEADLNPADDDAARLMQKLRDRNIDQMSFAFRTVKEEWDDTDPRSPLRTLREVKLYDVSPVTFPAYEGTDAQLRAVVASYRKFQGEDADLDAALDVLLARASERTATPEQAAEAREAVAVFRRLMSGEPVSEPQTHSDDDHSLDPERALRAIALRRRRLRVA